MLEYGSTRLSSKSHESRIYLHHTTENTEKYIDKYIKRNKREKENRARPRKNFPEKEKDTDIR